MEVGDNLRTFDVFIDQLNVVCKEQRETKTELIVLERFYVLVSFTQKKGHRAGIPYLF